MKTLSRATRWSTEEIQAFFDEHGVRVPVTPDVAVVLTHSIANLRSVRLLGPRLWIHLHLFWAISACASSTVIEDARAGHTVLLRLCRDAPDWFCPFWAPHMFLHLCDLPANREEFRNAFCSVLVRFAEDISLADLFERFHEHPLEAWEVLRGVALLVRPENKGPRWGCMLVTMTIRLNKGHSGLEWLKPWLVMLVSTGHRASFDRYVLPFLDARDPSDRCQMLFGLECVLALNIGGLPTASARDGRTVDEVAPLIDAVMQSICWSLYCPAVQVSIALSLLPQVSFDFEDVGLFIVVYVLVQRQSWARHFDAFIQWFNQHAETHRGAQAILGCFGLSHVIAPLLSDATWAWSEQFLAMATEVPLLLLHPIVVTPHALATLAESFGPGYNVDARRIQLRLPSILENSGWLNFAFQVCVEPPPGDYQVALADFTRPLWSYDVLIRRLPSKDVTVISITADESLHEVNWAYMRKQHPSNLRARLDESALPFDNLGTVKGWKIWTMFPSVRARLPELQWLTGLPDASPPVPHRLRPDVDVMSALCARDQMKLQVGPDGQSIVIPPVEAPVSMTETMPPLLSLVMLYQQAGLVLDPDAVNHAVWVALAHPTQALVKFSLPLRFLRQYGRRLDLTPKLALFATYMCVAPFVERVRMFLETYVGDGHMWHAQPVAIRLHLRPGADAALVLRTCLTNLTVYVATDDAEIDYYSTLRWLQDVSPGVLDAACIRTRSGRLFVAPHADARALEAAASLLARAFLLRCGLGTVFHPRMWELAYGQQPDTSDADFLREELPDLSQRITEADLGVLGEEWGEQLGTVQDAMSHVCGRRAARKLATSFCRAFDLVVDLDAFRSIITPAQMARLWGPSDVSGPNEPFRHLHWEPSLPAPGDFLTALSELARTDPNRLRSLLRGPSPPSMLDSPVHDYYIAALHGGRRPLLVDCPRHVIYIDSTATADVWGPALTAALADPAGAWW
jgi:hypothetical protein